MREPLEAMAADRGNKPSAMIREALRQFFRFAVHHGLLPDDYLPGSPWTDDSIQIRSGGGKRFKKPSPLLSCNLDELDEIARLFNANFGVPCAKQIQITLAISLKKYLNAIGDNSSDPLFTFIIDSELEKLDPDIAKLFANMLES